ncbi:hypothetical protein Tco_0340150 [Tanacetum coccineum]
MPNISDLSRISALILVLEALDSRQIGEDFSISLSEMVYKFVSLDPEIIMKYLVKIDKKARILELKRRYFKDYCSDDQYVVSFKEDTAYLFLHSPKTTKETRPIRRIQERQYAVSRKGNTPYSMLYGNKIFWKISNVVPAPRNPQYAVSKTLDTPYRYRLQAL